MGNTIIGSIVALVTITIAAILPIHQPSTDTIIDVSPLEMSETIAESDSKPIKQVQPIKPKISGNNASPAQIEGLVRHYAAKHNLNADYMVGVANCESTLGQDLVNEDYTAGGGHPAGIFQFLPETWQRIGSRSPYGAGNRMNPEDNIKVASWAFANGYSKEWACA